MACKIICFFCRGKGFRLIWTDNPEAARAAAQLGPAAKLAPAPCNFCGSRGKWTVGDED